MKKLDVIQSPGIYIARVNRVSYIVNIIGTLPFLQVKAVFNFDLFVNEGVIDGFDTNSDNDELCKHIIENFNDFEWYEFNYLASAEPPKEKKKSTLKNPYNLKQLKKWEEILHTKGEERALMYIAEETDLSIGAIQIEILPRLKRNETNS